MGKTTNNGRQRGSGSKLLLGGFVGLIIGVLIAFGVVLYLNKAPLPFLEKSGRPDYDGTTSNGQDALPLPGKPGDKPIEKPRFEFYKILPGTQEPAPNNNAANSSPSDDQEPGQVQAPAQQFYLQVGAFQKAADADNIKARLALIGVEASVQDVLIPDKGTLHRVRTGPYATPNEMNQVRTLMAQNGVQATLIKMRDTGNQMPDAESKTDRP
ncbi:MAG: SPOR domain-containing protein [Georgfuchsia sp.]